MKHVYLDNAATSRHKPAAVQQGIMDYLTQCGCSPSRGSYEGALQAGRILLETRQLAANLFHAPRPEQVVFTHNVTHALNYAIRGLLEPGDHVVTSSMEHNAVTRPLADLTAAGLVEASYAPCDSAGQLDPAKLAQSIRPNTKMMVVTHASNVTGTLMPIEELAAMAKAHDLFFVLDTAQTAGVYDLDMQSLSLDVLAFTGHKSLLGPPGTGGFVISERAAAAMNPIISGGTGSISHLVHQPDFLPDKFESGTPNTLGLAGLKGALEWIQTTTPKVIREHSQALTDQLLSGLTQVEGITIVGPGHSENQTSTVSITVENWDLGELSLALEDRWGIMTRSGLHCAPLAHRTLGTYPTGTLRLSLGWFNTAEDVDYVLEALDAV